MAKELLSEKQVKEALGIKKFSELSKDKIMEFASMIPDIDKDVALSIIQQFPDYVNFSKDTIEILSKQCDRILNSKDDSRKDTVKTYQFILEQFSQKINAGTLSSDDEKYYAQKMVEIADKVAEKDSEHKKFLEKLAIINGGAMIVALAIGGAILGVNIKAKDIPKLK